jgi:Mrp family chromosome partitioning ATPase
MNSNTDPKAGTSCSSGASGMAGKLQDAMIESSLAKIRHKLFVMSGKGGVGKSSIAANIAVALAEKGFQTGLLDVDLHGPSISQIMGIKGLLEINPDHFAVPRSFENGLKVVSMQSLLHQGEEDRAIIWRGPAKTGVIRQFLADVQWGTLDYLVIDSPPGTGDEPLSVAQCIKDARAIIVTTPQEIALSDVRKSINFCKLVDLAILGLVENMGPFPCPCCGKTIELFKSGGGARTAEKMGIEFLGSIPFDPEVVQSCDKGEPIFFKKPSAEFSKAVGNLVDAMLSRLGR